MKKPVLKIYNSFEEADRADREYWWSRTPAARMRELERLRQLNYGYGQRKPFPKFKRVIEIVDMKSES